MNEDKAVAALAALGQPTRLAVFRMLIKAGPAGLPAGAIAEALAVPPNTMSTHLRILMSAGLVSSARASRSIIYSTDVAGTRALLSFLVADCCGGKPEMCGALSEIAARACEPKRAGKSRR